MAFSLDKTVIILAILGLILANFSLAQETTPPASFEEAKKIGLKMLKKIPEIIVKTWKEEVLPIWQKMWNWFKINIWAKIQPRVKEEVEKRKPQIKEEFKKEKKELKEELPEVKKSLWERFKELIK